MDVQKTIKYWVEGAKKDMETIDVLFKEKQYSQSLFWCHLVLEKLLKAHVVKCTKTQAPYSHNLVQLSEKTDLKFSEEQRMWLADISGFNLMGRYPDEMMSFTKKCTLEFTEKYFSITKNFYKWLLETLSQ